MLIPRVIPVLLLQNRGLVKTLKFANPKYIGDPINAVRIFNDKEVDEIVFLDINASKTNSEPNYEIIENIASECFVPICYGGGVKTIDEIKTITKLGIEKVCINTKAFENPDFIKEAANKFGSSTIVVSIDVKKNIWGKQEVYTKSGTKNTKKTPLEAAILFEKCGAGEILINSIDRDGVQKGYDIDLIKQIASTVKIPVIACGGAGKIEDLKEAIDIGKASAAAAGSLFVFHGKHRAVLISYPEQNQLEKLFINKNE